MKIKDLKKGDLFTINAIPEPRKNQVYIRGEYDKSNKTYSCTRYDDMNNERFYKGDKPVFVSFTF